jgi:hypothetical protein
VVRVPGDDHLLELDDGRSIGYATWGDPEGSPVFIGHGTPGSRLDRYAALDDPEWRPSASCASPSCAVPMLG